MSRASLRFAPKLVILITSQVESSVPDQFTALLSLWASCAHCSQLCKSWWEKSVNFFVFLRLSSSISSREALTFVLWIFKGPTSLFTL
jgi:hypothetical protein